MKKQKKFLYLFFKVRGTVFCELDDSHIFNRIDFDDFEEKFKMPGPHSKDVNDTGLSTLPSKRFKKSDLISLLEHDRLRNIGMLPVYGQLLLSKSFQFNVYILFL